MNSFDEFELKPELLETLKRMGFEKPSPIQVAAIPLLKEFNKDFIGLAPTGTGKTAAFALPLLNYLTDHREPGLQALILCPTRELALQVATQINKFGIGSGLRAQAVYGGAGYAEQIRAIRSGCPIIVGTPGRLLDHMNSGTLKLNTLKALILDEADEMISMGFQEDIETILAAIPEGQSRLWLFSATMSPEIRKIADRFLHNPDRVELNHTQKVPSQLEQIYYVTRESNKPDVLAKLIEEVGNFYGLIFCQTKALVVELTQRLVDMGYKVDSMHGDKTQDARERTLKSFRERRLQVLVCTDVASRGIDVQDITHVVNYSLPRETENYIHRIGRTARSGKKGVAMALVSPAQRVLIGRIEKRTGVKMKEGVIPSTRILKDRKVGQLLEKFMATEVHAEGLSRVHGTWTEAMKEMTREEVAARLLSLISPELMRPTVVEPPPEPRREERRDSRGPRRPFNDRGPRRSYDEGDRRPRRDSDDSRPRRAFVRRDDAGPGEGRREDRGESRPRPQMGDKAHGEGRSEKRPAFGSERKRPTWGTKPKESSTMSFRERIKAKRKSEPSRRFE